MRIDAKQLSGEAFQIEEKNTDHCPHHKECRAKLERPPTPERFWRHLKKVCLFHMGHQWPHCERYREYEIKGKEKAMTRGQFVTCNRCGQELKRPQSINRARTLNGSAIAHVRGDITEVDLCGVCVKYFQEWWAEESKNAVEAAIEADEQERTKRKLLRDLNGQLWHRAKAAKDSAINAKRAADDTFRLINEIEEASK